MIDLRFRPMAAIAKKPRTDSRFKSKYSAILDKLEAELAKLNAKGIVIEAGFESSQIRNDGWPRSSARPTHPDVRLSFNSRGKEMAFPCSTYTDMEDNLYAIALTLEALRAINRYGVTQEDQQYRGFTALPAPESTSGVHPTVAAACTLAEAAGIKDFGPSTILADSVTRENAYRAAVKKHHPDAGGDRATWDKLQEAIGVLRGE